MATENNDKVIVKGREIKVYAFTPLKHAEFYEKTGIAFALSNVFTLKPRELIAFVKTVTDASDEEIEEILNSWELLTKVIRISLSSAGVQVEEITSTFRQE